MVGIIVQQCHIWVACGGNILTTIHVYWHLMYVRNISVKKNGKSHSGTKWPKFVLLIEYIDHYEKMIGMECQHRTAHVTAHILQ